MSPKEMRYPATMGETQAEVCAPMILIAEQLL